MGSRFGWWFGLLLAISPMLTSPVVAETATAYTVVDLGPADPGLPAIGSGINADGAVVAWARGADGTTAAFIARDGTELSRLGPDDGIATVLDINKGRTSVGWMSVRDAASGQFGPVRAARWQKGEAIDLGTLGGEQSVAYGINDKGHIVGGADAANGQHAFFWRQGEMTDFGTLGGDHSAAFEISNSGLVAGDSTIASDQTYGGAGTHAVLWTDGAPTDLGTIGGDLSRAFGVNDAGQVVGWSSVDATGDVMHAFLWEDGTMIDLGSLPGTERSMASDINSSGQIVGLAGEFGVSFDGTSAVLWDDGEIVDLNELIPADSGIRLAQAGAINDAGQIVCSGITADGQQHVFVLTPVTD